METIFTPARLRGLTLSLVGVLLVGGIGAEARSESEVYSADDAPKAAAKPADAAASKAAFREAYKVLMHPRCMNCHPAGDRPLVGDDSRIHPQNVQRGTDGKGKFAMRCTNCHQPKNVPGPHMPPGHPEWHLPPAKTPMVFQGKTPGELARTLKDKTLNGGKTLEEIYDHVAHDTLVGTSWNPGEGRSKPPLSRKEFAKAIRTWIDTGAAEPD